MLLLASISSFENKTNSIRQTFTVKGFEKNNKNSYLFFNKTIRMNMKISEKALVEYTTLKYDYFV